MNAADPLLGLVAGWGRSKLSQDNECRIMPMRKRVWRHPPPRHLGEGGLAEQLRALVYGVLLTRALLAGGTGRACLYSGAVACVAGGRAGVQCSCIGGGVRGGDSVAGGSS